MPLHKQVTTCLQSGGPISKLCGCPHCNLSVCAVCGAYEGGLTTDCPGETVSFDRQEEVGKTNLDYTDALGWHQGDDMQRREPRFEKTPKPDGSHLPRFTGHDAPPGVTAFTRIAGCSCGWVCPPHEQNSDDAFTRHAAFALAAPRDWRLLKRVENLKETIAQRAIAWVIADRLADQRSAELTRVEDAGTGATEARQTFHAADQRAVALNEELRAAANDLVEALEQGARGGT